MAYSPVSPIATAAEAAAGIFAQVTGYGALRTTAEGNSLFYDPFDAALDTNRWNTPTQSSGATVTQGTGGLTLASGTTASAIGALSSIPTFVGPVPSFVQIGYALKLESIATVTTPYSTGAERFWGVGTVTSPTAAAPLTDAVGWEIDYSTGHLQAVVYASGVRTVIYDLTANGKVMIDGAYHRYAMFMRTDRTYWYIDSLDTPICSSNFNFPTVQSLPLRIQVVNHTTPPGAPVSLITTGIAVGDMGENSSQIADGTYPWRKAKITTGGEISVTDIDAIQTGTITAASGFAAIASGTISATVPAANSFVPLAISDSVVGIELSGVWVGTMVFEATTDNTNWFPVNGVQSGSGAQVTSTTANGQWRVNSAGYQQFRVRASVYTSGTVNLTIVGHSGTGMVTLAEPLPSGTNNLGTVGHPNIVSLGNSTTAQLAANGVFTGVWEDVLGYGKVTVLVYSDFASAANGLAFQWSSNNGTTIDDTESFSVPGANGYTFSLPPEARYLRLVYTNGAGGTTTNLKIQTIYKVNAPIVMLGRSRQSLPAAGVSDGQRVGIFSDQVGRMVVAHNSPRVLVVKNSGTLTTTGAATLLAASGTAGMFVDLTLLTLTNTSSTATRATISDGTSTFDIAIAANGGAILPFNTPQPATTANTAWTITLAVAVTDVRFMAQGIKTV